MESMMHNMLKIRYMYTGLSKKYFKTLPSKYNSINKKINKTIDIITC